MSELRVPAAGRFCRKCSARMSLVRGTLRWRCSRCDYVLPDDPYLASVRDGAPRLPGIDDD